MHTVQMIVYMLNINGEPIYGTCREENYARVKSDASGHGWPCSIVEELYDYEYVPA